MFSCFLQKRTILFFCIFACLLTINLTQNSFASSSSNKNQTTEDTSFYKEKQKAGFFSKILSAVFKKKNIPNTRRKTDYLSKLNKKLLNFEKRIARVSRQKYNTKRSFRNKHSLTFKSTQLENILDLLANQRNLIVLQISSLEEEQSLFVKNKRISEPINTKTDNMAINGLSTSLSEINPERPEIIAQSVVTKETLRDKKSANPNEASKNKEISIVKITVRENGNEKVKGENITFHNRLLYKDGRNIGKQLSEQLLTAVQYASLSKKNNKEILITEKTPSLTKENNYDLVSTTPNSLKTQKLSGKSVESVIQQGEEEIVKVSSAISRNEVTVESITSISEKMEEQIREMVVNGNTDEIKMALEDGNSTGVLRVLIMKNIERQDLFLTEKDTINDYISILGKIGNEEDIEFLSDIKVVNSKLDDYYTHNIYSSIWNLKKRSGRNRIETRDDFDDAIDYISYIYNYYKTNTNEDMKLYNYEIGFLSEIIEAISISSFTQESIPLLAKLIEFENKDFVDFVNNIIDKIFRRLDVENSNKIIADFRP